MRGSDEWGGKSIKKNAVKQERNRLGNERWWYQLIINRLQKKQIYTSIIPCRSHGLYIRTTAVSYNIDRSHTTRATISEVSMTSGIQASQPRVSHGGTFSLFRSKSWLDLRQAGHGSLTP